jgi:hypothetical protein
MAYEFERPSMNQNLSAKRVFLEFCKFLVEFPARSDSDGYIPVKKWSASSVACPIH